MNSFRKLVFATLITSIAQTSLGSYVRTSGSGLGCGTDWPKCRGSWIPPLEATALIEYAHRITASVLGILILTIAVMAWLRFRAKKSIFWPSFVAMLLVVIQGWMGRQVVDKELARQLVAIHFFIAMTMIGLLVTLAVATRTQSGGRSTRFMWLSVMGAALAFFAIMLGAIVAQARAGLVFPDWPLMRGGLLPSFSASSEVIHWLHRLLALSTGGWLAYLAFGRHDFGARSVRFFAHGAFGLWTLQVGVGALVVLFLAGPWTVVPHVLLGSLLWATIVALPMLAFRSANRETAERPFQGGRSSVESLKAYFLLTKPRIIELLLIATVPTMILATDGWPPLFLLLTTLIGGSLSAGAANAINCYLDRDIDSAMTRTSIRPIPRNQIEPARALAFGILIGVLGFLWLWFLVNLLSAVLSTSALLFYVFVYTKWIKRLTPSNIVIGGAAGAAPVLVGWAAVRGSVELPALVLFAVIFFWTPPHFWALALKHRADYAKAGVPMLPVVRGVAETTRQMVLYSLVLIAVSLLLFPVASMGIIYLASAIFLGVLFVVQCIRLHAHPNDAAALQVFRHSITYLTLLFASIAVDTLVPTSVSSELARVVFAVATPMFFAAQGAILFSVLTYRRDPISLPKSEGGLIAEVVWTAIPSFVVMFLFISAWQAIIK